MALGVPGRLRPRIFSTFGTTRVVGHQSNAPAASTPGEIAGTHSQRLRRPQDTWFCRKEPRKKSQVTPPRIDPGTVRPVAQHLNHCATPGPLYMPMQKNIPAPSPPTKFWHCVHCHNGKGPSHFSDGLDDV